MSVGESELPYVAYTGHVSLRSKWKLGYQALWGTLVRESVSGPKRIVFYDTPDQFVTDAQPQLSLEFNNIVHVQLLEVKAKVKRLSRISSLHQFQIITTSGKHVFATKTAEECQQWVEKITNMLQGIPEPGVVYEFQVDVLPCGHADKLNLNGSYILKVSDNSLELLAADGAHPTHFHCSLSNISRVQCTAIVISGSKTGLLMIQTSSNTDVGERSLAFSTRSAADITQTIEQRRKLVAKSLDGAHKAPLQQAVPNHTHSGKFHPPAIPSRPKLPADVSLHLCPPSSKKLQRMSDPNPRGWTMELLSPQLQFGKTPDEAAVGGSTVDRKRDMYLNKSTGGLQLPSHISMASKSHESESPADGGSTVDVLLQEEPTNDNDATYLPLIDFQGNQSQETTDDSPYLSLVPLQGNKSQGRSEDDCGNKKTDRSGESADKSESAPQRARVRRTNSDLLSRGSVMRKGTIKIYKDPQVTIRTQHQLSVEDLPAVDKIYDHPQTYDLYSSSGNSRNEGGVDPRKFEDNETHPHPLHKKTSLMNCTSSQPTHADDTECEDDVFSSDDEEYAYVRCSPIYSPPRREEGIYVGLSIQEQSEQATAIARGTTCGSPREVNKGRQLPPLPPLPPPQLPPPRLPPNNEPCVYLDLTEQTSENIYDYVY